jgi:hypothetical protein
VRGFDLTGAAGNDVITGTNLADRIDGGVGNDVLDGGAGNDVYFFGRGGGVDRIVETDTTTGNLDTLRFASDVSVSDVQAVRSGSDISLAIVGTTDKIIIAGAYAADVIERVEFGGGTVWDAATLRANAVAAVNRAPAVSASNGTVFLDQAVAAGSLFSVSDADNDAITNYEFWDSTAGNGYFTLNGAQQGVNVAIAVSAADLANTQFVGAATAGSDQVWVRASDGQTWSDWKSWNVNSWPHLINAAPVISAGNGQALVGQSVSADSLFSVTDADNDAITQYEFWDDVAGSGHFSVNGVAQGAAQSIAVSAADLANTDYVGGATPGTEQVWVRANDGQEWSAWKPWQMSTVLHIPNAAPEVTAAGTQTVLLSEAVDAASLFSVTDADNDTITNYEFWDSTAGNGHFSVNGVAQGANVAIAVSAADLANTQFVGAATAGSDQVWVRANDGQTWSDWKSWNVNSWPHLTNAAPPVTAADSTLLQNEVAAAGSLFAVTDADGDTMSRYEFWDDVSGGGYFRVNGVQQAAGATIAVSASELAYAEYKGGANPGTERVWVRANDGLEWGAWKAWNMTTALHVPNAAPVVAASDQTILLGQSVDASSLFSAIDADNDPITNYEFWDSTAGNGHFGINGMAQGVNVTIPVSAADLANTQFVASSVSGSDQVWVRANDGQSWSDWKSWNVNSWPHATNAAPVVSAQIQGLLRGETVAAASLFSVNDADNDAITNYEFWDDINGGGYFKVNGVQQAAGQSIAVSAADLANTTYVGGASPGTEQVWVRANDGLAWGAWKNWLMSTEGGAVRGTAGPDTLHGDPNTPILEGGAGNDTLVADSATNSALLGGAGEDTLAGGAANDLLVGGTGNDNIDTGAGHNVIAHNAGDGIDTISANAAAQNTLSMGGGIGYDSLSLSKNGNDLVLNAGANDAVVLKDWYNGHDNVLTLQVILDATSAFDATAQDPMYNHRVQTFDFIGLVSQFDQAMAQSPGLTSWAVTNALTQFHLTSANDAALGGDLAYWYGENGTMAGISIASAQTVIGAPGFGQDAQTLRPFNGLQEGLVKLA